MSPHKLYLSRKDCNKKYIEESDRKDLHGSQVNFDNDCRLISLVCLSSTFICLSHESTANIIMADQNHEGVINFGAGPAKLPHEVY